MGPEVLRPAERAAAAEKRAVALPKWAVSADKTAGFSQPATDFKAVVSAASGAKKEGFKVKAALEEAWEEEVLPRRKAVSQPSSRSLYGTFA